MPTKSIENLPAELWPNIIDQIPNLTMGQLVRWSQVNRAFRSAFLSNNAWKKFDVFDVANDNEEKHIYRYGDYTLKGVAAHFFNELERLPKRERAWFLRTKKIGELYTKSFGLYSDINFLSLVPHNKERSSFTSGVEDLDRLLDIDSPSIWVLWATHLLERQPKDVYIFDLDEELLENKQLYLNLLKINVLCPMPEKFRNDWDVNLAFFWADGVKELKSSGTSLRANKQFVLEALSGLRHHFSYLKEVWLNRQLRDMLPVLCGLLWGDREVVLEAVKEYGCALQWADEPLRNDREVVLEAAKQNIKALEYASELLRDDRALMLAALEHDRRAIRFASDRLQDDPAVARAAGISTKTALEAIEGQKKMWQIASSLGQEEAFIDEVLERGELQLLRYSSGLQNDRNLALEVVEGNGMVLEYLSSEFQNDNAIVLAAVSSDEDALRFASERLQKDHRIQKAATGKHARYY